MLGPIRKVIIRFLFGAFDPESASKEAKDALTHVAEAQVEVTSLRGRVRALENDVLAAKSVAGRLTAVENQASAAHSRGERIETRLAKLEHSVNLMDAELWRTQPSLPTSDEDLPALVVPEGRQRCWKCEGSGSIGASKRCDSTGIHKIGLRICEACGGKGHVPKLDLDPDLLPPVTRQRTCATCRGAKAVVAGGPDCPACAGLGYVEVPV